ncbi:hypothetical protein O6H91_15G060700 [Diphasiastrum complanatum]|uniref:Uncharacterized protein n=1 Tax=Diphasiastrum complanatum TaxID=34168 RepID=A0ACC2BIV5_DIPCM|nr:hypothetical protein O6H91_15G060700 [Diphasiastrum complanatum]
MLIMLITCHYFVGPALLGHSPGDKSYSSPIDYMLASCSFEDKSYFPVLQNIFINDVIGRAHKGHMNHYVVIVIPSCCTR